MRGLYRLVLIFLSIFFLPAWFTLTANDHYLNDSKTQLATISLKEKLSKLKDGDITTIAGNPLGDNDLSENALFNYLTSITIDKRGNIFLAADSRIRKIDAVTKIITTVAGGKPNYNPDYTPIISPDGAIALGSPISVNDLVIDSSGNIIFSERGSRVRIIDAKTGKLGTIAGNGENGFSGDGGLATNASLSFPVSLALDKKDNLFIADTGNNRVRKVDTNGVITTVVGAGSDTYNGEGMLATEASVYVSDIEVDKFGNLFIADAHNARVYSVDASTNIFTTVVGTGETLYNGEGDGVLATKASIEVNEIELDKFGNIFVLESSWYRPRIRKVDAKTGIIKIIAGNGCNVFNGCYSGDGIPAIEGSFFYVNNFALDKDANLYVIEFLTTDENDRYYNFDHIRKVDSKTGIISTITSQPKSTPDGVPAELARLNSPASVTLDKTGNMFILDKKIVTKRTQEGDITFVDEGNIKRVDAQTTAVTTFAGNGQEGFSGDGELATKASFKKPSQILVDLLGNLLIVDTGNNRIRRIDAISGIITTIVGNGEKGYNGDTQLAINASLNSPTGIALDKAGNLFIQDTENKRIRVVDKNTGIISTIFVNQTKDNLFDLAIDGQNNLYAFSTDIYLFKLNLETKKETYTDLYDFNRNFSSGANLTVDDKGNIYFSGYFFGPGSKGAVFKVANNKAKPLVYEGLYGTDDCPSIKSSVHSPQGLSLDSEGNLFIADTGNHSIRVIKNAASK